MSKPANNREFVTVSQPYMAANEPGEIVFSVKIDTFSDMINNHRLIVEGIVNGIEAYIEKEKAAELWKAIEPKVMEYVESSVTLAVEKRILDVLAKVDLETLAKLATVGAAKRLGEGMVTV